MFDLDWVSEWWQNGQYFDRGHLREEERKKDMHASSVLMTKQSIMYWQLTFYRL